MNDASSSSSDTSSMPGLALRRGDDNDSDTSDSDSADDSSESDDSSSSYTGSSGDDSEDDEEDVSSIPPLMPDDGSSSDEESHPRKVSNRRRINYFTPNPPEEEAPLPVPQTITMAVRRKKKKHRRKKKVRIPRYYTLDGMENQHMFQHLPVDVNRNIATFLSMRDAVYYQCVCKRLKSDVDLHLLTDALPQLKNTTKRWRKQGVDRRLWRRITPLMFSTQIHSIIFTCRLKGSQRWRSNRAKLYIIELEDDTDENSATGRNILSSPIAQNEVMDIRFEFMPKPGKVYALCYRVGGGLVMGELHIFEPKFQALMFDSIVAKLANDKDLNLRNRFFRNVMKVVLDTTASAGHQEQMGGPYHEVFESIGLDLSNRKHVEGVRQVLTQYDSYPFDLPEDTAANATRAAANAVNAEEAAYTGPFDDDGPNGEIRTQEQIANAARRMHRVLEHDNFRNFVPWEPEMRMRYPLLRHPFAGEDFFRHLHRIGRGDNNGLNPNRNPLNGIRLNPRNPLNGRPVNELDGAGAAGIVPPIVGLGVPVDGARAAGIIPPIVALAQLE